jgi:hypothetical protein
MAATRNSGPVWRSTTPISLGPEVIRGGVGHKGVTYLREFGPRELAEFTDDGVKVHLPIPLGMEPTCAEGRGRPSAQSRGTVGPQ